MEEKRDPRASAREWLRKILTLRHKDRKKSTRVATIVVYDFEKFEELKDLANREGTNISSIFNNMYEDFMDRLDSPQKSLDQFTSPSPFPLSEVEIKKLLDKINTPAEYRAKVEPFIEALVRLSNIKWGQLQAPPRKDFL